MEAVVSSQMFQGRICTCERLLELVVSLRRIGLEVQGCQQDLDLYYLNYTPYNTKTTVETKWMGKSRCNMVWNRVWKENSSTAERPIRHMKASIYVQKNFVEDGGLLYSPWGTTTAQLGGHVWSSCCSWTAAPITPYHWLCYVEVCVHTVHSPSVPSLRHSAISHYCETSLGKSGRNVFYSDCYILDNLPLL